MLCFFAAALCSLAACLAHLDADTKIGAKLMSGNNKIIIGKRRKVANDAIVEKHMLKAAVWGVHPVQKCSSLCGSGRHWANLDANMLEEILSRVPIHDLLNATFVCQSWKDVCCNMLFWRHDVLDLSATSVGFHPNLCPMELLPLAESRRLPGLLGEPQTEEQYNKIAKSLSRLLQLALEDDSLQNWGFSIHTVILPYDFEILDCHLHYIAERTLSIKHLMLLNIRRITLNGFGLAIRNWWCLKEIHLGIMDRRKCACFLLLLGLYQRRLEFLHLHQRGMVIDETLAKWIVKNLPMVKKIVFDSCWILPCVLKGFFLYGKNVKELYFSKCGLPVDANLGYLLNQIYDPDRLVVNFALSWTECNQGYPSWHPVFTSNDDTSANRVKAWLREEVRCPPRPVAS
ncbi:hypothetical protein Cgig2_008157 [Carnegiea gigantea]|uniref:F-box domain-containing protein n=1 Tax=Carnegiea gigantea TaxID=171969 RepID=A0A9Q1L2F4_9CARY|nr:hypothetical protein Cgig2_008157 [Carnegiea gigantea]